jgi:hypothetical protein
MFALRQLDLPCVSFQQLAPPDRALCLKLDELICHLKMLPPRISRYLGPEMEALLETMEDVERWTGVFPICRLPVQLLPTEGSGEEWVVPYVGRFAFVVRRFPDSGDCLVTVIESDYVKAITLALAGIRLVVASDHQKQEVEVLVGRCLRLQSRRKTPPCRNLGYAVAQAIGGRTSCAWTWFNEHLLPNWFALEPESQHGNMLRHGNRMLLVQRPPASTRGCSLTIIESDPIALDHLEAIAPKQVPIFI